MITYTHTWYTAVSVRENHARAITLTRGKTALCPHLTNNLKIARSLVIVVYKIFQIIRLAITILQK